MSNKIKRRPLVFQNLADSLEEIRRLQLAGYRMAGNWNLGQICDHLTRTLKMSMEGSTFRLPFFVRPIARWMLFRRVMEGKPTGLPLMTPKQFVPDEAEDPEPCIQSYERAVHCVIGKDAKLIELHPIFGKVNREEWRCFHAWHAAHHLSHLIPKFASND